MVVKDCNGNELVRVIKITENEANKLYTPITHCLAIVMVGNEYLLGTLLKDLGSDEKIAEIDKALLTFYGGENSGF